MSGVQIGQIQETPGSALQCVWPLNSLMTLTATVIGANSSLLLFETIGAATPAGNDVIHGSTPVIDGAFNVSGVSGACLGIFVSYDGIAFVDMFDRILLMGAETTYFGPIELPSFTCRFRLYNNDTGAGNTLAGTIRMRSM